VKEYSLPLEQFSATLLMEDGLDVHPSNLKLHSEYQLKYLAKQFTLVLTAPTAPIQDRIVAEYPLTLWDHIKSKLRLKYKKASIRFKELAVYPHIAVPPYTCKEMRIYRAVTTSYGDAT
jgi:hypothetical protein